MWYFLRNGVGREVRYNFICNSLCQFKSHQISLALFIQHWLGNSNIYFHHENITSGYLISYLLMEHMYITCFGSPAPGPRCQWRRRRNSRDPSSLSSYLCTSCMVLGTEIRGIGGAVWIHTDHPAFEVGILLIYKHFWVPRSSWLFEHCDLSCPALSRIPRDW